MDKKSVIFVIEDDPGFNMMMTEYLKSKNKWDVYSFITGEECLEKLDLNPSIFLQDYDLPKMNGIEVLKHVKKVLPEAEFIFLSAQTEIKIAVEAIQLGAFDYIVKDGHAKSNTLNKIDQVMKIKKLQEEKKNDKVSKNILLGLLILALIAFILIVAL
jgi:DNA-binding NtrC family response regulator